MDELIKLRLATRCQWLSGVIQGSAIKPLMFLIFINELISLLENHDDDDDGIKVKLFADDVKYLRVVNDADIIKLQSALDTLSDWAAIPGS